MQTGFWRLPTSFQSTSSLFKLVKYLKRYRPPVLLSATHYINEVAIVAKKAEIPHPWFKDKDIPIVVGAGRFVRQKEFSTLIRAFAQVLQHCPARLVLLGDGRDREDLEALVNELGIKESVWMPGFMGNPYAYLKQADVFVLSSAWEGLPTILIEAIALGTPVVSTNCPSGPAEILKDGAYGRLTPTGNVALMAANVLSTLKSKQKKFRLNGFKNSH